MAFKTFDATKGSEYPGFTLYPFFHRTGKMTWASAAVIDMKRIEKLIYLSGQTGRDPETDRIPRNWEEQRAGVGTVVGPRAKEQTIACWQRIKETLDGLGAVLDDILFIHYYVAKRDDVWEMKDATMAFFEEHGPDLIENPRAGTLLLDVGLALPSMLVEIEVVAATGKSSD